MIKIKGIDASNFLPYNFSHIFVYINGYCECYSIWNIWNNTIICLSDGITMSCVSDTNILCLSDEITMQSVSDTNILWLSDDITMSCLSDTNILCLCDDITMSCVSDTNILCLCDVIWCGELLSGLSLTMWYVSHILYNILLCYVSRILSAYKSQMYGSMASRFSDCACLITAHHKLC